ncbi:MAG: protein kinase, partial [Ignavibacteriaceae bacterium]
MVDEKNIAHYHIIDLLGEGGMGTVYKAQDTSTGKIVALKVLLQRSLQDPEIKHRFQREAHAGMQFNHPNIVKIFETGEADGEFFISMEYVEGKNLRQLLRENPMETLQVIDIGIAAGEALSHAHQLGVIHRDIKSDNIMVTNEGILKVMDFGLAKVQDASILTKAASVLGTISYMSPQQAIGEAIDFRSDIFSLGVVLYELLTAKMPFTGDYEMAVIYSILNEDPVGIRELNDKVPKALEHIINKALKKDVEQRYQNILELVEDLKKIKEVSGKLETAEQEEIKLVADEEINRFEEKGFIAELTGRTKQFELLKSLLSKSTVGQGQTVFITGEAGIGKTRIVWELEKHAKTLKVRTLKCKCLFKQGGYPYQPFVDAIRSYFEIKGLENDANLKQFVEEQAPDLISFLPVIRVFLNIKDNNIKDNENLIIESKEQFWDAIYKLLIKISKERPVILFVDDMHWADEDTINLFYYISRNSISSKFMLIGTYRIEDIKPDKEHKTLLEIQRELNREGIVTVIELNRLSDSNIKEMTSSIFKNVEFENNFYSTLAKETEGNPFFIIETLKLLQSENIIEKIDGSFQLKEDFKNYSIPSKVYDLVIRRIERLNNEDRELLEVASVEGESFHSGTLVNCLGFNRITILKKLQNLEREHHIIHPADKMYRFDHGKIRESLYDSITPELRSEYHLLIGNYLEEIYRGDERMAPNIAMHFIEGGENIKALPFIISSAERAKIVFANEQAIEFYENALEIINNAGKAKIEDEGIYKEIIFEGLADVQALTGKHKESL